ncbi:MAG: hypothetical protein L6435_00645 [Anaerolineae bacterium]|nr:hypothetical protein [Anaerolineae bacterium]
MNGFTEILNEAMSKGGFTVRSLESELLERYGSKKKISRSLIGDYKQGKRAPTYEGARMIAGVLGISQDEFLAAAFRLKNEVREEAERQRFEEFCRREKIDVPERWLR